jgi:hypothetical protein
LKPVDPIPELLRLRDGSSSALTSALRDLSARGPDASELASLATRLSLQGIAMTPPTAAPPTRGPSHTAWQLGLTGAAVVGVAAWLLWPTTSGPRVWGAPPAPSSYTAPVAGEASSSAPGRRRLTNEAPPKQAPASSAAAEAATASEPTAPPSPSEPEPRQIRPSVDRTRPGAGPEATSDPALRDAPVVRRASNLPLPTDNSNEGPTGAIAAPSELELLRGARLSLKSSPVAALRLAEEHRSRYPSGKLTQERELIAISALVALGHRTAALSRAAGFERAFPTSPYRKQIGELLQ